MIKMTKDNPFEGEEALIRAVLAAPNDGSLRLIYADWLEERGDSRGEYLRVMTLLNGRTKPVRDYKEMYRRLQQLHNSIDPLWRELVNRRRSMKEIAVHEPFEWRGPNPIRATGRGLIYCKGRAYYLLDVQTPFPCYGKLVRQLAVAERYEGDTIDQAVSGRCTVGVSRIRPRWTLEPGQALSFNQVAYFAIGDICSVRVKRRKSHSTPCRGASDRLRRGLEK